MNSDIVKEYVTSTGRIFHRRERNRTITVAYQRHEDPVHGPVILYGATIHKRTSPSDTWNRRLHNLTAVRRATTNPCMIRDRDFENSRNREDTIRNALLEVGVSGGLAEDL